MGLKKAYQNLLASLPVPATAIFHQGNVPAVWVIGAGNSTLELRPVTVRSYSDHSTVVTSGLKEGEAVGTLGKSKPPVSEMFEGVFEKPDWRVREQRQELEG